MALLSFDETAVFPKKIAFGFEGGPSWFTTITQTAGGSEQRNLNWSDAIHKYTVAHEFTNQSELDDLVNFFNARRGRGIGFRFRDWADYCTDMPGLNAQLQLASPPADDTLPAASVLTPDDMINTVTEAAGGDDVTTTFQIVKNYPAVGTGTAYDRNLTKIVDSHIYIDAAVQTITTDYTIDTATGIVTFTSAPLSSETPKADAMFDVPARFDTDDLARSLDDFNLSTWRNVKIVEIRV